MTVIIHKSLQNEGLVDAAASIPGISRTIPEGSSIYYGTGLTTSKALSNGLPFDVLGMILMAEKLYRTLRLSHIYHHIADTHALTNSFATLFKVEEIADKIENIMIQITKHLNIQDHFTIFRSSSFDRTPEYIELLKTVTTIKNNYVQREVADMHWYKEKHQTALKLGWIIQTNPCEQGFDERLFDSEYTNCFGNGLQFIYLKAGRTFDQKRPKAAPYISIPGEQRILLQPNEDVEGKITKAKEIWPDKTLGGACNHLSAIVRLYDQIAPKSSGQDIMPKRIQTIIDRIFS